MKLKIGEREKNIILGLIGVAVPLLVYFFIFTKLNEQKDVLVTENQSLAQEVAHLQELMDNKEFYLAETDRMNAEMEEIKAQFPSELHPEDEIYYAYNMENKYDVLATAIDMPVAEAVAISQPVTAEAQPEVVDDGTGEGTENTGESQPEQAAPVASAATSIALYRAPITFNFKLTYTAAKDWIKEILSDKENKKSIDNVTLNYDDSTGNLTGSIIVNMFSLTGTDRVYEAPSIQGIGIGTDNLFKSSETLNVGRENNTFDANAESAETENNSQPANEEQKKQ